MRKPAGGFTLIELMIVVAIIAIIASMAIPNLLASRLNTNEAAAIATLRTIASAEAVSQIRAAVDEDSDGVGEYLYLGELSGSSPLRSTGLTIDPAAVSVSVGNVSNSVSIKAGYNFAIFLAETGGAGVAEDPDGGKAAPGAIDADLAETFWVAYAWPNSYAGTGRRAFAVNQSGNIVQTQNSVNEYSGLDSMPAADAAFTEAGDITSEFSISGIPAAAQDGGTWIPIN